MRKMLDGSKMVRGKKKRTNIRKLVAKNPPTVAQTMRRRVLLTGGSGVLSRTAPVARAAVGLAMPLATPATAVELALAAPGATRAAGVVFAGTSLAGVASVGTLPAVSDVFGSLSTPKTSLYKNRLDGFIMSGSIDDRLRPESFGQIVQLPVSQK